MIQHVHHPAAGDSLPGFDHILRYRDPYHERDVAKLLPGQFYITRVGEVLASVVGSCVVACVRDPVMGLAGMVHFMVPDAGMVRLQSVGHRRLYGPHAIDALLQKLVQAGAAQERLEAKLFGGGHVFGFDDRAAANAGFLKRYLVKRGVAVLTEDLGGTLPRKVYFDGATGRSWIKYLHRLNNDTIYQREMHYWAAQAVPALWHQPFQHEVLEPA